MGLFDIFKKKKEDEIAVKKAIEEINFFIDSRDGKKYKTVKIGNQIWMAENLNYEISGKQIPDNDEWEHNKTCNGWCFLNNNKIEYSDVYGILYQKEAAIDACPKGWHLPSDNEWKELEMTIGMSRNEVDELAIRGNCGNKLKSINGWTNDKNGTDEFGFSGLPGGSRLWNGAFGKERLEGSWWSSTNDDYKGAFYRSLKYDYDSIARLFASREMGFSVRCVRD